MKKAALFFRSIVFAITLIVLLNACNKEADNTPNPSPVKEFVGFVQPQEFPNPLYKFNNNPITEKGFYLGKKLFYDGILSRDGSISCGSCHMQTAAFAHLDHSLSHGIDDLLGTRNSPSIQNMAWNPFFFWDGGVMDLDLFPFSPIQNPVEMDEKLPNVIHKLRNHPEYPKLFKEAFNVDSINSKELMYALSQFMNMLVSANSRYDQYIRGNVNAMNADEVEGMNLFMQNCNSCHTAPLFTDNKFHNNGIARFVDKGRQQITLQDSDLYKFKTPTLRNIEKTFPYMHDGRMNTLEEVMNHYTSNIASTGTIDARLHGGITLSPNEKSKVLAFLKTLTDEEFLKNPLFAE